MFSRIRITLADFAKNYAKSIWCLKLFFLLLLVIFTIFIVCCSLAIPAAAASKYDPGIIPEHVVLAMAKAKMVSSQAQIDRFYDLLVTAGKHPWLFQELMQQIQLVEQTELKSYKVLKDFLEHLHMLSHNNPDAFAQLMSVGDHNSYARKRIFLEFIRDTHINLVTYYDLIQQLNGFFDNNPVVCISDLDKLVECLRYDGFIYKSVDPSTCVDVAWKVVIVR